MVKLVKTSLFQVVLLLLGCARLCCISFVSFIALRCVALAAFSCIGNKGVIQIVMIKYRKGLSEKAFCC